MEGGRSFRDKTNECLREFFNWKETLSLSCSSSGEPWQSWNASVTLLRSFSAKILLWKIHSKSLAQESFQNGLNACSCENEWIFQSALCATRSKDFPLDENNFKRCHEFFNNSTLVWNFSIKIFATLCFENSLNLASSSKRENNPSRSLNFNERTFYRAAQWTNLFFLSNHLGFPSIFIGFWAVVKAFSEENVKQKELECSWMRESNTDWIIQAPACIVLIINLTFLIRIMFVSRALARLSANLIKIRAVTLILMTLHRSGSNYEIAFSEHGGNTPIS